MKKKYKYLFKNLGILTISNFASKILVFLLVPLYTSVLSTQEYGLYDLILTTIQLIFPVVTLNIVDAVMRFLMDKNSDRSTIITYGYKYIFSGLVLGGIGIATLHYIPIFKDLHGLEFLIYLYYASYILNQFYIQMAKGLERVSDMGIAGVLSTIAMLIFNVLFLIVLKTGLRGFIVANIFAQTIPVLYFTKRIKPWKYFTSRRDKNLHYQMIQYCAPLIFSVLGWWVNSAADKYTVAFMIGVAANGILSVSYKIPSIMNTLQSIFIQAWQISAIKEYGSKETSKFYGNAFTYLNMLMSISCSILILFTRPIAHVLYAKDFYQAWQYVPFLLISSVLNAAAGFIGPILSAQKNSRAMALSAIYGAVANVIFNIVLVYMIGIQGATIATVISSFVIYQVRFCAAKKEFESIRYGVTIISWGLLIVQALSESYFQSSYIEVFIFICLIALYFGKIRTITNKILIYSKNKIRKNT